MVVPGSPERYGPGHVSSLRSFLEGVTRKHARTPLGGVKSVKAMLRAPWHGMVCPLPALGKGSAHQEFYFSLSSPVCEGEHERGHEHRHKTAPQMAGNEGPNYIPPLALTLGHHAQAIIYSGQVIRELGPGN